MGKLQSTMVKIWTKISMQKCNNGPKTTALVNWYLIREICIFFPKYLKKWSKRNFGFQIESKINSSIEKVLLKSKWNANVLTNLRPLCSIWKVPCKKKSRDNFIKWTFGQRNGWTFSPYERTVSPFLFPDISTVIRWWQIFFVAPTPLRFCQKKVGWNFVNDEHLCKCH